MCGAAPQQKSLSGEEEPAFAMYGGRIFDLTSPDFEHEISELDYEQKKVIASLRTLVVKQKYRKLNDQLIQKAIIEADALSDEPTGEALLSEEPDESDYESYGGAHYNEGPFNALATEVLIFIIFHVLGMTIIIIILLAKCPDEEDSGWFKKKRDSDSKPGEKEKDSIMPAKKKSLEPEESEEEEEEDEPEPEVGHLRSSHLPHAPYGYETAYVPTQIPAHPGYVVYEPPQEIGSMGSEGLTPHQSHPSSMSSDDRASYYLRRLRDDMQNRKPRGDRSRNYPSGITSHIQSLRQMEAEEQQNKKHKQDAVTQHVLVPDLELRDMKSARIIQESKKEMQGKKDSLLQEVAAEKGKIRRYLLKHGISLYSKKHEQKPDSKVEESKSETTVLKKESQDKKADKLQHVYSASAHDRISVLKSEKHQRDMNKLKFAKTTLSPQGRITELLSRAGRMRLQMGVLQKQQDKEEKTEQTTDKMQTKAPETTETELQAETPDDNDSDRVRPDESHERSDIIESKSEKKADEDKHTVRSTLQTSDRSESELLMQVKVPSYVQDAETPNATSIRSHQHTDIEVSDETPERHSLEDNKSESRETSEKSNIRDSQSRIPEWFNPLSDSERPNLKDRRQPKYFLNSSTEQEDEVSESEKNEISSTSRSHSRTPEWFKPLCDSERPGLNIRKYHKLLESSSPENKRSEKHDHTFYERKRESYLQQLDKKQRYRRMKIREQKSFVRMSDVKSHRHQDSAEQQQDRKSEMVQQTSEIKLEDVKGDRYQHHSDAEQQDIKIDTQEQRFRIKIYSEPESLVKLNNSTSERQPEYRKEPDSIQQADRDKLEERKLYRDKSEERKLHRDKSEERKLHRDKLEEKKSPRDKLEEKKSHRDKLEERKSHRDKLEEKKSPRDKLEETKSHRDKLEERKSHRDKLEETKSHRDKLEERKSPRDKLEETKSHRDKLEERKSHRDKSEERKSFCVRSEERMSDSVRPEERMSDNVKSEERMSDSVKSEERISESVRSEERMSVSPKPEERISESVRSEERVSESSVSEERMSESVRSEERKPEQHVKVSEREVESEQFEQMSGIEISASGQQTPEPSTVAATSDMKSHGEPSVQQPSKYWEADSVHLQGRIAETYQDIQLQFKRLDRYMRKSSIEQTEDKMSKFWKARGEEIRAYTASILPLSSPSIRSSESEVVQNELVHHHEHHRRRERREHRESKETHQSEHRKGERKHISHSERLRKILEVPVVRLRDRKPVTEILTVEVDDNELQKQRQMMEHQRKISSLPKENESSDFSSHKETSRVTCEIITEDSIEVKASGSGTHKKILRSHREEPKSDKPPKAKKRVSFSDESISLVEKRRKARERARTQQYYQTAWVNDEDIEQTDDHKEARPKHHGKKSILRKFGGSKRHKER